MGKQRFELDDKAVKTGVLPTNHCILTSRSGTVSGCYLFVCEGGEEVLKFVSAVSLGERNYFVDFSSHDSPALGVSRKMETI